MTQSPNACQSFGIIAKVLKLLEIICRFMYLLISNIYLVGLARF